MNRAKGIYARKRSLSQSLSSSGAYCLEVKTKTPLNVMAGMLSSLTAPATLLDRGAAGQPHS